MGKRAEFISRFNGPGKYSRAGRICDIQWDAPAPSISIHEVHVQFRSGGRWLTWEVRFNRIRRCTLREAIVLTVPRGRDVVLKHLAIGRRTEKGTMIYDICPVGGYWGMTPADMLLAEDHIHNQAVAQHVRARRRRARRKGRFYIRKLLFGKRNQAASAAHI